MYQEPVSSPDTLQDLCIFFCVEHLECLTPRHSGVSGSCVSYSGEGDTVTHEHDLPTALCDKLLVRCMKTCLQDQKSWQKYDALQPLLRRKNICSKLSLLRREILTENDICDISNSSITHVNLFGCNEYTFRNKGIELLMKHNKKTIVSLRLNGILGEDQGNLHYYSFLPDPETSQSYTSEYEGGSSFSITGDFCAKKRFSKHTSVQSSEPEQLILLQLDGCFKETSSVDEVYWYCFPKLQSFSIISTDNRYSMSSELITWNMLVSNPQLTSLCLVAIDVNSWCPQVSKLKHLTSLTLSSCSQKNSAPVPFSQHLTQLENLRHLDISTAGGCNYTDAELDQFRTYVQSASRLTSLELAGTNLSMIVGHNKQCSSNESFNPVHCSDNCMAPLDNRRFQYLGLVNCPHLPYMHKYIPAAKISGLNGGQQVLMALWSYQHNYGLMSSVLDYLTELFSHPEEKQSSLFPAAYIDALLALLDQYPDWEIASVDSVQPPTLRFTGKVLYQLYKILAKCHRTFGISIIQRRRMLERMLVLLGNCLRDMEQDHFIFVDYVSRLACVVLLCLPLPEDAVYCYQLDKYVRTLICVVEMRPKPMNIHLALRLIHTACRYSQELKARIGGEFKLTEILLTLITEKTDLDDTDMIETVVDKSWSVIWTLTDEVPSNCKKFIECGGLDISIDELSNGDSHEQRRKISGALSNVAENPNLRPFLCRDDLVTKMRDMLAVIPEGIDVSSHAAAFLVLLAADGPNAWTVETLSRDTVLEEVESTIDQWKLDASRGVKFRSLSPMLEQMENSETPVAQYWACWMICNLVTVNPTRYCWMMEVEGGLEVLERTKIQPNLYYKVNTLVDTITKILEENKGVIPIEDDY